MNKICPICNIEYNANNNKQIYCSLKCKIAGQDSSHLLKYSFKKGFIPWNKGKKNPKLTEQMRTGIYLTCDFCKNTIYVPKWRINRTKFHFCSQSCNNKFRTGELGRNYINGSSFKDYPVEFNINLKNKIKNRDENQCVLCGMNEQQHKNKYHKKLMIHHIDYDKMNCDKDNLITLCLKHNSVVNKKEARNRWIECFKTIINLQKGILD